MKIIDVIKIIIFATVFVLFIASLAVRCEAQPTKAVDTIDEWAEVAQNAVREGATKDVSGAYDVILHISVALSTETAHTGTKIEVQISVNSSGDEDWTTLTSFIGPIGTANSEVTSASEAAGQTVIECASTTGYDADETRWIFFEHTTPANSEFALLVSHVSNTSVTLQDGITNDQTAGTMFNIAQNYVVQLPFSANRVRIIYDNTFDVDGSTVHTLARLSKVTGI